MQDRKTKLSCKYFVLLKLCQKVHGLFFRLTLGEVLSKGFVDCIAWETKVGVVIPDLEVETQQSES